MKIPLKILLKYSKYTLLIVIPVKPDLLGQIVVDDEGVHAVVTEVLSHGTARVGSQVLQGSGIRGCGTDHDGVLHGI